MVPDMYSGHVSVGGPADVRELPNLVISKLAVGPMDNNAYLLRCTRTGAQLLIDAAAEPDRRGDVTRIYVIQLGHGYSLSIFSDRADCAPAPVPVADRIVGPIASVVQRR